MRINAENLVAWWTVPLLFFLFFLTSVAASGGDLRLVDAVKIEDKAAVTALLKQKVDVNTPQPDGTTALHWAAHRAIPDIVNLLLRAGAQVNVVDDLGVTPLSLACTTGNIAVVEMLLKAGANPNAALSTGETPLMTAARVGKVDVVRTLHAYGAEVNTIESWKGQTALMWAAAEGHAEVARLLLELGADVHARSMGEFTPLLFTARIGNQDTARVLLAAGADINETDVDGLTPLLVATLRGHTAFATFLLDQGADVNKDSAGYTALHWAVGQWDSLLTGFFGLKAESSKWSAAGGLKGAPKREFVKTLLARGANPHARLAKHPPRWGGENGGRSATPAGGVDFTGATPFFLAAAAWDADTMRLLLDAGADPYVTTKNTVQLGGRNNAGSNTTPLMVANGLGEEPGRGRWTESAALEATKLLVVGLGVDVNAANDAGNTALHAVAIRGADTIVQFLVDHGAHVNVMNKRGDTPFMIANAQGPRVGGSTPNHPTTTELFRMVGADASMEHDGVKVDVRPASAYKKKLPIRVIESPQS